MKRFGKLRLLLGIVLLAGVTLAVIVLASPYAPVVEPCRDIEEIWAIEDARQESEMPLVTALEMDGASLGYDAESNIFYCTLGMDGGDEWPDIHLTAPGSRGVSLCFVDDYTYDWRTDAIRDGYEYQIIAYTDEEFSYASLVFTGLPIVTLDTAQPLLPHEDIPVTVSISAAGEAPLTAYARAHERGDTTLRMRPKHGIKVEFTRNQDGTRKTAQRMPFLGETDEFILLACSMDQLLIRDKLSWDLWNGISSTDEPFGPRETTYCEVFAGDEYLGIYLIMRPFDYVTELTHLDKNAPAADSLYRLAGRSVYEFDKPLIQDHRAIYYEQHYTPAGVKGHAALEPYLDMFAEESDEVFAQKALSMLDLDSVIRYALFIQACGMTDNEHNNLYIICHHEDGGYRYLFAPWDLDVSWGRDDDENAEVWYPFDLFDRLVELDCGDVRERVGRIWRQMRETAFSDENVERLITSYDVEMGDSGAFYRDAVKWNRPNFYADSYNTIAYAASRFAMMDARIEEITSDAHKGHRLRIEGYTTFDDGPLEADL